MQNKHDRKCSENSNSKQTNVLTHNKGSKRFLEQKVVKTETISWDTVLPNDDTKK